MADGFMVRRRFDLDCQLPRYSGTGVPEAETGDRASAQRSLGHGKGNPWWDKSCKDARRQFKQSLRANLSDDAVKEVRKAYQKTIKRAKELFFRSKIEKANSPKEIFSATKWHKSTGTFRSSPLKDTRFPEFPSAVTLTENIKVMVDNLLVNSAETTLPFPPLTLEEIRRSGLNAGNTSTGADEVPTAILRLVWPLIESHILNLFTGCLSTGHYSMCFRRAILIVLQKSNKVDLSSPRSYRLIALLSVLGKGLERTLAKRISWIAIHEKVLASQHFGAVPYRSAINLVAYLTHDFERALSEGRTASMLTLDIEGAFDAVLPGRLIRRLREQGWPHNLINWIESFTTGRSVQIRLDGEIGPL
ncbi:hypothetical protein K3495_g1149 [Podosphaera aphanis]|nr:hypothetical protein K3495_g1149 [Podosphaera aphanis]